MLFMDHYYCKDPLPCKKHALINLPWLATPSYIIKEDTIREAIMTKEVDINATDNQGMSSFLLAVRSGNIDAVVFLWNKGVDRIQQSYSNAIPSILAVRSCNPKGMIKTLLELGVHLHNPGFWNNEVWPHISPYEEIAMCLLITVHRDCPELILGCDSLSSIANCGSAELLHIALRIGTYHSNITVRIRQSDIMRYAEENTLLIRYITVCLSHFGVMSNYEKNTLLIRYGADVDSQNFLQPIHRDGELLIERRAWEGKRSIVCLFIAAGVDILTLPYSLMTLTSYSRYILDLFFVKPQTEENLSEFLKQGIRLPLSEELTIAKRAVRQAHIDLILAPMIQIGARFISLGVSPLSVVSIIDAFIPVSRKLDYFVKITIAEAIQKFWKQNDDDSVAEGRIS